jgi:hypothetical protein
MRISESDILEWAASGRRRDRMCGDISTQSVMPAQSAPSQRLRPPNVRSRFPDCRPEEPSPLHDGIQPMEAKPLLLPVCSSGHLIGLFPYRAPVVGTGQAGCHWTLFRAPLLPSRHLQPFSLLGVFPLAEQAPAAKDRIARGSTGSPERLRWPGRMTRPEPGPLVYLL